MSRDGPTEAPDQSQVSTRRRSGQRASLGMLGGSGVQPLRRDDEAPGPTHREVGRACGEPERGRRNPARALVVIWPAEARIGKRQPAHNVARQCGFPTAERLKGSEGQTAQAVSPIERYERWGQWPGNGSRGASQDVLGTDPVQYPVRIWGAGRGRRETYSGDTVSESWSQVRDR